MKTKKLKIFKLGDCLILFMPKLLNKKR